jgi:hypothetical protein
VYNSLIKQGISGAANLVMTFIQSRRAPLAPIAEAIMVPSEF